MPKQAPKGKSKGSASERRAALAREKENRFNLQLAVARRDLLDEHTSTSTYCTVGLQATINCVQGNVLTEDDMAFCLKLMRLSADAFDEEAKRSTLRDERSRVLMVHGEGDALVEEEWLLVPSVEELSDMSASSDSGGSSCLGFVHLQFATDRSVPALLALEMHLLPEARGKGLGQHIMKLLDAVSKQLRLPLVLFGELNTLHAKAFATGNREEVVQPMEPGPAAALASSPAVRAC